jgi:hypothetical protein
VDGEAVIELGWIDRAGSDLPLALALVLEGGESLFSLLGLLLSVKGSLVDFSFDSRFLKGVFFVESQIDNVVSTTQSGTKAGRNYQNAHSASSNSSENFISHRVPQINPIKNRQNRHQKSQTQNSPPKQSHQSSFIEPQSTPKEEKKCATKSKKKQSASTPPATNSTKNG